MLQSLLLNCLLVLNHVDGTFIPANELNHVTGTFIPTNGLGTAVVRGSQPLETSQAKWLGLRTIDWVDEAGRERKWEVAYRKTAGGESSSTGKPDSVAILAKVLRPHRPPEIILVHQFRPPVNKIVVELPAGLVDKDESVEKAALRELLEETGYGQPPHGGTATVGHVSDMIVNDPGMSEAKMVMVNVAISLNDPDAVPVPRQEPGPILISINHLIVT
ncbi:uncharacterized protein VP01_22g5 [Puccinia sorghi]|uniref:Nudix hydrolase domain-containing protein n=1 Tax=Puccinia sorghi TaxID=27349 RepID=A0A0L6V7V8_9BASI|nr:uncharacterized protein VP01_22g5 [Puccinia sorghi]